ncbi:MAG TPA: hypothetical protein PK317_00635 [Coprothermobacter proteolyticus]|jgi:hypothetical protein|nr:hypothetical protein [Coprothermobacter proteolyticus]
MSNSILQSTKKTLGLAEDYTAFDQDIIMHINSVFSTLVMLGVGPETGFVIEDETDTWEEFTTDVRLNSVKSYMYLKVRLLFDPPSTSFVLSALQEQIKELEWRMNVYREVYATPDQLLLTNIIDGGQA